MDDCHLDYLHHKIEREKRKNKKTGTTSLVQRSQITKGPVLKLFSYTYYIKPTRLCPQTLSQEHPCVSLLTFANCKSYEME